MNPHQAAYLISDSLKTLWRHRGVMILSVMIMSLTLLVLAVFLLATENMLAVLERTSDELEVYVYLYDSADEQTQEATYVQIMRIPDAETVIFVSKAEALQEFREQLGEESGVLGALESNPLPASFRVKLKNATSESTEAFAKRVSGMAAVEEVNYGKEFVDQFTVLTRAFMYVNVVLGLIVLLSAIFIISNTVRLTVLTRQKSIEILRLVGATNVFITTPFVIEGAIQAGLAAILSLVFLFFIHNVIQEIIPGLMFLGTEQMFIYFMTCVLLGALGSYASLRRSLKF